MALYSISALLPEQHDNVSTVPIRKPQSSTQLPFVVRAPTPVVPAPVPQRTSASTSLRTRQTANDSSASRAMAECPGVVNNGTGTVLSTNGYPFQWGNGGQSGDGEGGYGQEQLSATGLGSDMDTEALLDLLPIGGDSGIFEVLLPDGQHIGVVTDVRDSLASFLLTTGNDKLRSQLQRKRVELESGLVRRMSRQVRLAVL